MSITKPLLSEKHFYYSHMGDTAHPVNTGLDLDFQGRISKKVLCNYLSRAMVISDCTTKATSLDDDLRMVLNTGAKYIARSGGAWDPTRAYIESLGRQKSSIDMLHRSNDDLICEACIFEHVCPAVNDIMVPRWVLEEFGLPVKGRNFSYKRMSPWLGPFRDHFGRGLSVPDIRRVETRMFFYYLACEHIDAGYEGLHLGQVHLTGCRDEAWANWTEVVDKIRSFAAERARRGCVLLNAHTFGIIDSHGKLMFDFHAHPVRGRAPVGSIPHPATEEVPQEILPGMGLEKDIRDLTYKDSIFTHSLGGVTPSGWDCESLPYLVELDNWNGYTPHLLDRPTFGDEISWWGFDEISWFANQPKWYRSRWLENTVQWIRTVDPVGHLEMPGRRTAAIRQGDGNILQTNYSASITAGSGDEEVIRRIWMRV